MLGRYEDDEAKLHMMMMMVLVEEISKKLEQPARNAKQVGSARRVESGWTDGRIDGEVVRQIRLMVVELKQANTTHSPQSKQSVQLITVSCDVLLAVRHFGRVCLWWP